MPKVLELDLISQLRGIHSALDDVLGDSDIEHMEDEELRDAHPVQWAAARLSETIRDLDEDEEEIKCAMHYAIKDTWGESDPSDACIETLLEQLRQRGVRLTFRP